MRHKRVYARPWPGLKGVYARLRGLWTGVNALINALCPAVTRTLDDPSNLSLSVVFTVFDASTKFASGPGFGFLDHAPELKSLGIDCFLDRSAREVVRRSVIGTDRAGGGPGTMILRQLAAREVGRERPQILPRFRLENVNPHGLILSGVDDGRRMRHGASLEVGAHQIVRPFAAALINLGCRRADQVPMRIERAQQPRLVEAHLGLNALERVLGDEECNLHRAVVSPKTHRAPRRIERAALVGKTQPHRRPFAAVPASGRAADHDRPPSAARARRYPLDRATRLLYAMTTAATPKQAAEANARLNTVIHMSRSSYCRRERDWSLGHRRLDCSCVMADDGMTVRSMHAIVQGI